LLVGGRQVGRELQFPDTAPARHAEWCWTMAKSDYEVTAEELMAHFSRRAFAGAPPDVQVVQVGLRSGLAWAADIANVCCDGDADVVLRLRSTSGLLLILHIECDPTDEYKILSFGIGLPDGVSTTMIHTANMRAVHSVVDVGTVLVDH